MRNPPKTILCSFCNRPPEGHIRSPIGGEPPVICYDCIVAYALVITERASRIEADSVPR
jgi:hypothetical protein